MFNRAKNREIFQNFLNQIFNNKIKEQIVITELEKYMNLQY